ncbi:MAG TPA: type II toxin-antitoxin system prevent-host-death family antitoxin [Allosphingosinicella sp.]|nr:type II toxin-antitoxin system prevent-host-death family antitoxin [Allosphingosinicella sp.]
MGRMIGAAEFKAKCLRIIDEVERSGESVTITKRGRPMVEVKPVENKERHSIIGAMKGSVLRYDRPFDPAIDPQEWHANR